MYVRRFWFLIVALLPALVHAGWLADVEVYDRTAHRMLPVYEHEGRLYVAGEPRHQYEVRIRNRSERRVLAVTSVDGVNVVSGKTAAAHQGGYVVDAWSDVHIDGWRKSLDEVATFYFTRLKDSYAARTGRPQNVGVIGVALFREREVCCRYRPPHEPMTEQAAGAAPPARAETQQSNQSANASADSVYEEKRQSSRLGTGHGHRESSPAQQVEFHRAASTPDETVVIYYDSYRNLVAQGVLPDEAWYAYRKPNPFPDGFVPDP